MRYEILKTNGFLRIIADDQERNDLRDLRDERTKAHETPDADGKVGPCFGTSADETDALESLIGNSELGWLPEGSTGDLTSAPMLGILGEEGPHDTSGCGDLTVFPPNFGLIRTGHTGTYPTAQPIIARWAYMGYQTQSFLDELIFRGYVDFEGGYAPGLGLSKGIETLPLGSGYKSEPTVTITMLAKDLQPGNRLDLEHDKYANDPVWEFEVGIVEQVRKFKDTVSVSFTNGNEIVFPNRHRVTLVEAADPANAETGLI